MRTLKNTKKCAIEIATILAQDETLCKLLVNDKASALTDEKPDKSLNDLIKENYISIYPPVENRIEEYGRNTFLSILVNSVTFSGQNLNAGVLIYVSTDESHVLLNNNKDRLLEMADRIVQLLQNHKISAAGELNVSSITHVMLSEFHTAYRIAVNFSDQQNGNGEV